MTQAEWLEEFSESLRYELKRSNMSQRQFSLFIGVSDSTMSELLSGQVMPSVKTALKISIALGIPLDDILNYGEPIE